MIRRHWRALVACVPLVACGDASSSVVDARPVPDAVTADPASFANASVTVPADPVVASATIAPETTPPVVAATVDPVSVPPATVPATGLAVDAPVSACAVTIVVLGNSTDYWANFDAGAVGPGSDAWPAVLGERLAGRFGEAVTVDNESSLGAGFDVGFLGVVSMDDRLSDAIADGLPSPSIVVIAPSVVDLQMKDRDVGASFAAFETLHQRAAAVADRVVTLPMNPVAAPQSVVTAEAIADFNAELAAHGYLDPSYRVSPLLDGAGPFGQPSLFDDFDDDRANTPGPDPDGIHPDTDGHALVGEAVTPLIAATVSSVCET